MSEGEFNLKSSSKSFRVGVIIFLFCSTFFHWLNRANENIQYSTSSKCHECGASYSGNGWSTIGGEQYQAKDPRYNLYCSKECAYNSQPNRWK